MIDDCDIDGTDSLSCWFQWMMALWWHIINTGNKNINYDSFYITWCIIDRIAAIFLALTYSYLYFFLFFRGHGTYLNDNKLYASIAGVVERVNKLISVRPLRTK